MKTIYKYPLEIKDTQFIKLPAGAQILTAQTQKTGYREQLCLWALVDTDNKTKTREIVIIGTGNPIKLADESWLLNYISTVQQLDGRLVWHVFEIIPRPSSVQNIVYETDKD